MFILYLSHVPVVTYEMNATGDPGAGPAARKMKGKEQFFFG